MNSRFIHFETLGCRLNQDETEGAARTFSLADFSVDMESVTARDSAREDVVLSVVNTCTVTAKAEQKARRIIRLLLEKFPVAPVLVTGCYAELDASEIKAINPERVCVLSGTNKFYLASLASELGKNFSDFTDAGGVVQASRIEAFLADVNASGGADISGASGRFVGGADTAGASGAQTHSLSPKTSRSPDMFSLYTPVFQQHSRASIKIQDGCNCACSFCRIHLARGKSISLEVEEAVRRVQELESMGLSEVVCTGVNLSQYASFDASGNRIDFTKLLNILLSETSCIKFRISSLYPQSVDEAFCRVAENSRIQPFFHLSIQSGSDAILKRMNRPHNVENVFRSVEALRSVKENPFISSDLIAGFPGETEEDFALTKELCERVNFAWIHAFPFSPRPGTPAKDMKPQIPERIKDERVRWLTECAVQGKLRYINEWQGCTVEAVVESSRAQRLSLSRKPELIHAVTDNFLHVECRAGEKEVRPGSTVRVRIDCALEDAIRSGKEIECTGTVV